MPSSPSLPSSVATSLGNSPFSNHSSMEGRTRSPTHSRVASRIIRSSSNSRASTSRKSVGSRGEGPGAIALTVAITLPTGMAEDEGADEGGAARPSPARFGREGGELSYGAYLRVPELLSLQALLSKPPAHDELLFVIVHQAYELWFREFLFDLESVRHCLFTGDTHGARHWLKRVHAIERVMIEHINVIETMSPQDFLEFRHNLAPASGFQSVQFREIEFLSGLKEPGLL